MVTATRLARSFSAYNNYFVAFHSTLDFKLSYYKLYLQKKLATAWLFIKIVTFVYNVIEELQLGPLLLSLIWTSKIKYHCILYLTVLPFLPMLILFFILVKNSVIENNSLLSWVIFFLNESYLSHNTCYRQANVISHLNNGTCRLVILYTYLYIIIYV